MAQSAMWQVIDPSAEFRAAAGTSGPGYADPAEFPAKLLEGGKGGFTAKVPHFGFAVVLVATAAGLYYVFEHGGAGGKVGGHVGPVGAELEADLGKGEGKK